MICTHCSEQGSSGLDREQLSWDLSHETKGITQLDFFTLDRDSLCVNGEWVSSYSGICPWQSLQTM
jgi:hypothetical protein